MQSKDHANFSYLDDPGGSVELSTVVSRACGKGIWGAWDRIVE